jgi:NAD(P)H-dependent flavin oxidoreductase YrpB (nitropropane dioxygenase family)
MVIKSKFCEQLGVKHPVMSGGMHYASYAELAAAVSEAGGLGVITALTQPSPEDLRKEIRKCKALTSKPFGVNMTLLPAMVPPDYKGYAQVIIDEKVPIVETAGNNPGEWIKLFKSHGIKIIHKCVAIRHALSAQKMGVDFLSIDGFECGGHPGEDDVGNFVLLALAAKKISVPFIASGGVATGRQLAAALALGAEGVNCGTRFLASKECPIRQEIKDAIVKGSELDTTHVFRTLKNTERVFKNKTSVKVVELEKQRPGEFEVIRPYVSGAMYKDSFHVSGDTTSSVWSCGQSMGLIDSAPSVKEIIEGMVQECEQSIRSMTARL